MKKTTLLMAFAAFSMLPTAAPAQDATKLGEQMEAMNDAYKAFRKETDPAKGAALAREAQASAIKGLLETPEMVKEIKDPAEKAKSEVIYKKMMLKLVSSLVDVEEAFLAGNLEEVAKIVESLKDQKKEGHDKFIPEE